MDSRTAFEATFTPLRYRMHKERGEYVATDTEAAWLGWKAATERAAKVCEAMEREKWEGLKKGRTMLYNSAMDYAAAIRGS